MKKLLLIIAITFSLVAKAQAPTNGLLAYYNFEGNGNSHNGLYNLTNLHTTGTPVTYAPGGNGTGYAAEFNNTGLQNTSLAAEITSEFTIAYWGSKNPFEENLYATRFEMFASAFHRKSSGSLYSYAISTFNGVYSGGDLGGGSAGGGVGGWFHYAMCFKTVGATKVIEFYVNGVLDSSATINNTNAIYKYNQVFSIGGGTNGDGTVNGAKFFDGSIDEFYVYNRALSVTEINTVKNAPVSYPQSPPIISNISVTANSATAVSLNYILNANGAAATSVINYGTSPTNLSSQVASGSASGTANTNISTVLNGLVPNMTYYYQIVSTNSFGSNSSAILSFVPSDLGKIAEYNFNNTYNNVNGSVPFGADGTFTSFENDRNNVSLGALRINATQSAAVIPNLPVGNAPRTVSIWVKKPMQATDAHVFRYGPLANGSTNLVYGLSIQDNNLVNFGYNNDLTAVGYGTTGTNWIHVVTTFDGTTAKIYHNGVERASGNKSAWNTQNTNFFLGGNNDISVDDLKIYNRVLTQAEITNLYTNNSLLASPDFNSKDLSASIYPNPTTNNFTIEIENELKSVEIYSLQGQKVLTAHTKSVNVSNLSKGLYLVRITAENQKSVTQKLIVN